MCDYSLQDIQSRPAKIADKLVTAKFPGTMTRGFAAIDNSAVAICLRPGTELAFEHTVEYGSLFRRLLSFWRGSSAGTLARFRQIDLENPYAHHDAVEFADGTVVLLTRLKRGQVAAVLQMPSEQGPNHADRTARATFLPEPAEAQ
jgi:hypothetical protein